MKPITQQEITDYVGEHIQGFHLSRYHILKANSRLNSVQSNLHFNSSIFEQKLYILTVQHQRTRLLAASNRFIAAAPGCGDVGSSVTRSSKGTMPTGVRMA